MVEFAARVLGIDPVYGPCDYCEDPATGLVYHVKSGERQFVCAKHFQTEVVW